MSKDDLLACLRDLAVSAENGDREIDHMRADWALLAHIGDAEIREAFDSIPKWYA